MSQSSSSATSSLRLWRRRYVTVFVVAGGGLVLASVVELLVLDRLDGRRWSWWGLALLLGLVGLVVAVAVVSWRVQSRGSTRELWESGSPAEVRAVSRALRRNEPVPVGGSAIAQVVVDRNARMLRQGRRRFLLLYGLLAAVFAFEFLVQHGTARWFYLVGAVGYLVLAVFLRRGSPRLTTNAASQGIYATVDDRRQPGSRDV